MKITPIILCGGSGTRLWPLSRAGFPKQFLSLTGTDSLYQQSIQRLMALATDTITVSPPLVVTGEEHRFLASEQIRECGISLGAALLEPIGRNTAPALTLAALSACESDGDSILVVTPSDQTIALPDAFTVSARAAIEEATKGSVVILGIKPSHPETGYGYIQASMTPSAAWDVQQFVEKPDLTTASQYVNSGDYFWNAGMFVLKASVWLNAMAEFRPDILAIVTNAWNQRRIDGVFVRPDASFFESSPSESIDYAVMEHCPGSKFPIKMIPLDAGWSDLGAWDAVWRALPKDDHGNVHQGDVITEDARNTLVHASSRLVSLVGVEDLVVVETADAVLVTDMSRSQEVKRIVELLHRYQRDEQVIHRKVNRPWGWYDCIDQSDRFKVKRIQVNPGASLSLQKHHHRAEHWIVVKGTAEIINSDQVIMLTENQSTYIPVGAVHRLKNPGCIPLEIIEVQSGSYLGEDDIVRFEDNYGRIFS